MRPFKLQWVVDDYCSHILCTECTQHRHTVGAHRLGGIETAQHCRLWKEYQAIHWSANECHLKSASINFYCVFCTTWPISISNWYQGQYSCHAKPY